MQEEDEKHHESLLNKLRPFQREAYEFAVNGLSPDGKDEQKRCAGAGSGRILLADEMGLGKTISSLAIMSAYQLEWPLLILCPASLRYTWPNEIEKFLPWFSSQSTYVVRGADDVAFAQKIINWRQKKAEQKKTRLKPPYRIVVCTYSLLQNRFACSKALQNCNFECVIADESHNLKQKSSQRCELALPIMKQSKRLVLLSGTPALNRPVELYAQLTALDPHGQMFPGSGNMSYSQYTKRYCNARQTRFGYDVKGISNAGELHSSLKKVMLRRLKSQVLKDLPSKQRSIVPIEMKDKDKIQDSRYVMEDWNAACKSLDGITNLDADDVAHAAKNETRRAMMRAYQASGVAKASAVSDYVIDWLRGSDSSQKLVVFAHHKDVMDCLQDAVAKEFKGRLGMMRIDGSVSPLERSSRVKQFQTNKSVRLALLSMTAAGVGLTLTAASNIIFAELHWTPGVLAQAEDRCHRIGQRSSVNCTYCICKEEDLSIDMIIWKMLSNKTGNLSKIMDGERKGLDAVETKLDFNASRGSSDRCVSAEEELVNFFATSKSSKANPKPPVKGTIQSFFNKQTTAKASSKVDEVKSDRRKSPDSVECISLIDASHETKENKQTSLHSDACISLLEEDDTLSFVNCPTCTFENRSDSTICVMCSSSICSASPFRRASGQNISHEWECSACTFANEEDVVACKVCGTERQDESLTSKRGIQPDSHLTESKSNESNPSMSESQKQIVRKGHEFPSKFDMNTHKTNQIQPLQLPEQLPSSSDDDDGFDEDEEPVVHQLDHKQGRKNASPNLSQSSTSVTSDLIDLTQQEDKVAHSQSCNYGNMQSILCFNVSKNSGRIALYLNSTAESLDVNFDISQILTLQCANYLQEVTLSRKPSKTQMTLQFDDVRMKHLLSELFNRDLFLPSDTSRDSLLSMMVNEVKSFITSYMNLREVEKKAVKESNEIIEASALNRTAAKLLQSTVCGSTERYSNGGKALGAKERAVENVRNNVATDSDRLVLRKLACAWCAAPFQKQNLTHDVDATYCSFECAEEGRIRRGNIFSSTKIRESLFALER